MALYRGLPYDLPLGIELYSEVDSSEVEVASLPEADQQTVTDHELRSEDDARSLIDSIESSAAEPAPKPENGGWQARRAAADQGGKQQGGGRPGGRRRRHRSPPAAPATASEPMSARNRELFALIPVAVLLIAGFAAVFITDTEEISNVSLIYGGYFLAICLGAHILLRIRLPYADPYLFPLAALLAGVGLVVIYRIDDGLAVRQATLFLIGLGLFAATIIFLRDYHVLERYRYLIAIGSILFLFSPFLLRNQVNGAYLQVNLGPFSFQPSEFAKIGGRHLPRQLPGGEPGDALGLGAKIPGADVAPAEALRAASGGVGRGDDDAVLRPRPRQLADVLRRVPGAALRRHRALLVRSRRARPVLRRRGVPGQPHTARPGPGGHLDGPVRQQRP